MVVVRSLVLVVGALVGCGGGGGFPDASGPDAPPPGGTLSLSWAVTNTASQPITCDQIGGQTVTLLLRKRGIIGGQTEVFGCMGGSGTTPPVPPGIYDIDFELGGLTGLLARAPSQMGLTVISGENTPLAPISFAVDAIGGLDLHLNSNLAGGNCGPIGAMGAGITAMTITLNYTGGACLPVTFTIGAGATTPPGSYTVNCASPMIAPCIENDQRITATNVPSGGYVIHVRGKIGATDCWTNDNGLQVPPLGMNLQRTLSLVKQPLPGC